MPYAAKGYTGSYVEQIQKRLNKAVAGVSLTPDGKFGSKTEDAVILFQKQVHLIADGIVGDFTDAVLFEKPLERLSSRPAEVFQASASNCWAAATESWLTVRKDRRRWTQEQLIKGLQEDGGARSDGALLIPSGQGMWELYVGLRPVSNAPTEFFAELASSRISKNGPLVVGYKPASSSVGHVEVMWGVTIHKNEPAVVTMDPLRSGSHMKVIRISELHKMTGKITTWFPVAPKII